MPMTRGWLKFSGYMTVVCAMFTMIIGLDIWFETLKTRENLSIIWNKQPSTTQSLLQQQVGGNDDLFRVMLTVSVSLLRLQEQYLTTIRSRHDMSECTRRSSPGWLCWSVGHFRQQLSRHHLYWCIRYCWCGCSSDSYDRNTTQGPEGEGEVSTYRWEKWRRGFLNCGGWTMGLCGSLEGWGLFSSVSNIVYLALIPSSQV